MVFVHAQTDLVAPPPVTSTGGPHPTPWSPDWLVSLVEAAATNRARLLFLLLAGVGASLYARRRGIRDSVLLRRALFLLGLGAVLAASGWGDVVLVFYAVLFALAPALLRLPSPWLVVIAALFVSQAGISLAVDPTRASDATGVLLILGEAIPMFCVGIVIGRLALTDVAVTRRLALIGSLLAAPGLVVLGVAGHLDLAGETSAGDLVAATTSTCGLSLILLAACLTLFRRGPNHVVKALALTGGMPLTGYVGHALLFPRIESGPPLSLLAATLVAVGYLTAAVLFAGWWRRRHRTGPVEAVLRRVGGT